MSIVDVQAAEDDGYLVVWDEDIAEPMLIVPEWGLDGWDDERVYAVLELPDTSDGFDQQARLCGDCLPHCFITPDGKIFHLQQDSSAYAFCGDYRTDGEEWGNVVWITEARVCEDPDDGYDDVPLFKMIAADTAEGIEDNWTYWEMYERGIAALREYFLVD